MADEEMLKKQYTLLRIIIFTMLIIAPACYAFMVYQLGGENTRPIQPNATIVYLMFALAIISAIVIPVFDRIGMWKNMGVTNLRRGMTPLQSAQSLIIVRLAFLESIYICGLVIFFVTRLTMYFPYFAALGVLCTVLHWPTYGRYTEIVRTLEEP